MSVAPDNQATLRHNGAPTASELENQKEGGYQGGIAPQRSLTPGGHFFDDNLIIAASSHRRLANPVPTATFAFATTTLTLSLYNCGVQGIKLPENIVAYALFYGGFVQYLAGLMEFASGNTFGATVFCSYGCFWWGLSFLFVPFFGQLANYSPEMPGVYTAMGLGAAEGDNAVGLYLFIWLGITLCLTFTTIRSSITVISLLVLLDITFILLGLFYYTGNEKLQLAGGIVGCVLAFNAYYLGASSLLTPQTSSFTLPVGSLARKD